MFLHVRRARYLGAYEIELEFNDGRNGVADLSSSLTGTVFEALRDKSAFAKVAVDEELGTIVWPNGADLAPEYLYFLAFRADPKLQEQFQEWGYLVAAEA